jgi:hypothetical protein
MPGSGHRGVFSQRKLISVNTRRMRDHHYEAMRREPFSIEKRLT